ncbi:hypothetical protein SVAN01_06661 [Stagonosporopsis vannaccii]|nr:hypothetical protein SVAN01_06661 [Stagonosporopsis vannaccii]
MLEQGNVALARLTSRNAPARLVPGVDLLEDFSTVMRELRVHVRCKFSCGVINGKGNPSHTTSSDVFVIISLVERTPRYVSRLI